MWDIAEHTSMKYEELVVGAVRNADGIKIRRLPEHVSSFENMFTCFPWKVATSCKCMRVMFIVQKSNNQQLNLLVSVRANARTCGVTIALEQCSL